MMMEAEYRDYKFHASLQGVDLDKQVTKADNQFINDVNTVQNKMLTFQDPKEYEKLTKEEREEITRKMMGEHKRWMGENTKNELGKG
jgi:uncharacterized HAD superfamily protein